MARKIPAGGDARGELASELARVVRAETPTQRGELFGFSSGSEEEKAVHLKVLHSERAGHEKARREAIAMVPAVPPANYNMLPAIEGRIRRGDDWRNVLWGPEAVWDLFRRGVALLADDAAERENLLAAIVAEIARTVRLRDWEARRTELETLSPVLALEELLGAFRLARSPGFELFNEALRATAGEAPDAARRMARKLRRADTESLRPNAAELESAAPLLRDLVRRLRALRERPLPTPRDYSGEWEDIRATWCAIVIAKRWATLPLLCEACGKPVLLRASRRLRGGAVERSTVCSESCRQVAKDRRKKAAARVSR